MQILANPENYINAIASVQPEKPGQYASIISNLGCKLSEIHSCGSVLETLCIFHKHLEELEELAYSYESENIFPE